MTSRHTFTAIHAHADTYGHPAAQRCCWCCFGVQRTWQRRGRAGFEWEMVRPSAWAALEEASEPAQQATIKGKREGGRGCRHAYGPCTNAKFSGNVRAQDLTRQYRESGLPSTQRLRHPTHPRISRHKMARWLFTHAHNRKELALTMDAVMLSLLFKLRQSSSRLLHTSVSATVVGDAAPWDIRTTA